MKHQTNEICVLGGFFSVIDYIINQISNILNNFGTYNFFKIMAICFDKLSALLGFTFIILFFMILLGKKISILQKFITVFPKISTYFHYIGGAGYILLLFNLPVLIALEFISLPITNQIIYFIIGTNVLGLIIALILATKTVFLPSQKEK